MTVGSGLDFTYKNGETDQYTILESLAAARG